jgi:SAM-dependent methyltransferase
VPPYTLHVISTSWTAADHPLSAGCVVCGPDVSSEGLEVPETMFRTGEVFGYRLCNRCGSMQIADVPEDLARYYSPEQYYSFSAVGPQANARRDAWAYSRVAVYRRRLQMRIRPDKPDSKDWLAIVRMTPTDRVLDIGCGDGYNLRRLRRLGFTRLKGIDPFLPTQRTNVFDVPITRATHGEVEGVFDWIMLHHVLEHVADPRATLRSCRRLVAEHGKVLVRMPVMGALAWREYGVNWAQLDAPRHLIVYSLPGFRSLVEQEGFKLERIFFDSNRFQFWASEQAALGRAHSIGPVGFSDEQLLKWDCESERLNQTLDGDQFGAVLTFDGTTSF